MKKLTEKQVGELQSKISDKLWQNFDTEKSELNNVYLAAPEMFSMLEQALRLIAVAENNNAYKDCALPLIGQRTIEQIESILKKARGES